MLSPDKNSTTSVCVGDVGGYELGWGAVQLPAGVFALPTSVPSIANNKGFAFSTFPISKGWTDLVNKQMEVYAAKDRASRRRRQDIKPDLGEIC